MVDVDCEIASLPQGFAYGWFTGNNTNSITIPEAIGYSRIVVSNYTDTYLPELYDQNLYVVIHVDLSTAGFSPRFYFYSTRGGGSSGQVVSGNAYFSNGNLSTYNQQYIFANQQYFWKAW